MEGNVLGTWTKGGTDGPRWPFECCVDITSLFRKKAAQSLFIDTPSKGQIRDFTGESLVIRRIGKCLWALVVQTRYRTMLIYKRGTRSLLKMKNYLENVKIPSLYPTNRLPEFFTTFSGTFLPFFFFLIS